jgi:hypothetical protein
VKNTCARTRIGSGCVQGPPTGKNSYPCPLDQVFDGYLISIPELPSGLHKSAHDHVHTIRCHFNWEKVSNTPRVEGWGVDPDFDAGRSRQLWWRGGPLNLYI